jgi:hypothetical protein
MRLAKRIAAIVVLSFMSSLPASAADLSPAHWPQAEKTQAEAAEMVPWPMQARTVEGPSGLVAATMSPIAVRSGIEALKQGGTAAMPPPRSRSRR